MLKRLLALIAMSGLLPLAISGQLLAVSPSPALNLVGGYAKSGGTYDVVTKGQPGVKLELYVNGVNPMKATVNKQSYATFHKVRLSNSGKLSFTSVLKNKSGKSYQQPINYVRYYNVASNKVTFSPNQPSVANPAPAPPVAPVVPTPAPVAPPVVTTPPAADPVTAVAAPIETTPALDCTNGSYVNTAGNTVCSPEQSATVPDGATAQCLDGSYSFSQSRRGTCSHHGGVAQWLN